MLDIGDKHTAKFILPSDQEKEEKRKKREEQLRAMADGSSPPPSARRTRSPLATGSRDPESAYQFDMLPSIDSHVPKRVTQGGKKGKRAMATVFGAGAGGSSKDLGRRNSAAGMLGGSKSRSPSTRMNRSDSPGGRWARNSNFLTDPSKYVTESGKSIDMNSAYRRLSDAALLRSGGSLASLASRKGSDPTKGESISPGGGVRLEKDYYADADDDAIESTDEEDDSDVDSDDESRGRRRRRSSNNTEIKSKLPKSLLAAAEDDRQRMSGDYRVRSLLEPAVTVTGPNGEKMTQKKKGVHPSTNFDAVGSGMSTPMTSDTEQDISEIKRAQRMAMTMSPIHSTPAAHRCIRQVLRGDYAGMQREAEMGLRRQRMYLVATDLSEEAAYALEWTIGTVLRDGDTLLAVYAVDEEVGTGGESGAIGIGEGAQMMRDTASLVKTLSHNQRVIDDGHSKSKSRHQSLGPSPLQKSFQPTDANEQEPDLSSMDKAERERWHATMEVSDRIVSLLRKTKLQVRAVIEVFHCKSPKHMITEVIDFLDPTLVILGSRGRSALKGVLLGSFSNYLVTKSSVPVMVARKRLRKHSKYKRGNLRLSNVLTNPTSKLASAKID
ncbi:Universal stress protein A [Macrophomina phaseolina MS6]|uniref:Universal stress protein A n=2 Tax=Macrophomina phaseolina TaxID=35725 RepID=K2REV3_MACPH|nr:Universal stress protein A [Macrophomina phaseolina MS6]